MTQGAIKAASKRIQMKIIQENLVDHFTSITSDAITVIGKLLSDSMIPHYTLPKSYQGTRGFVLMQCKVAQENESKLSFKLHMKKNTAIYLST